MLRVAEHFSCACQRFYEVNNAYQRRRIKRTGWPNTSLTPSKDYAASGEGGQGGQAVTGCIITPEPSPGGQTALSHSFSSTRHI